MLRLGGAINLIQVPTARPCKPSLPVKQLEALSNNLSAEFQAVVTLTLPRFPSIFPKIPFTKMSFQGLPHPFSSAQSPGGLQFSDLQAASPWLCIPVPSP